MCLYFTVKCVFQYVQSIPRLVAYLNFRLWDATDNYLRSCTNEVVQKAVEWNVKCRKKLTKRTEVKSALLKARYERVRIDIYERRLAELQLHMERLERHKAVCNVFNL